MAAMRLFVTGGTGSFGSAFTEHMLSRGHRVTVFSRDELKQAEMAARLPGADYVLGDIRDTARLCQVMWGHDAIIHAAAMKRVPECEANPAECIATNVIGSRNVVLAASRAGCNAVALSTDKAASPDNVYGATKLLTERMFLEAGFGVVRCGNIWGSRGSIVPLLREQAKTGRVTVTDPHMTRYSITLDTAVRFVEAALFYRGLHIPVMPTYRIMDLVEALAPGCDVGYIGIRPGERLHEQLITEDEAPRAYCADGRYVIGSEPCGIRNIYSNDGVGFERCPGALSSDHSTNWLSVEQMRAMP
jgi:UDP-N-acetylglucosamine 4,6-dehydratase/5-epimerase